ncbi:phage tail assembly chaperone [Pseudochrobactrum algeriensis]|uniref:phage tail assembly chaperone n=1 Tax=Brucellaceae TaxID=118882 RepID=UPI0009522C46|nr:phage tail assembly chaperone [Ochrobactrum sp. SFR4]QVQ38198.1 phage tail assembly chaperone [Pseudochrobactrum algeriensis]QVQ41424.1 phage tail assembly chaperone [Pseudochrobactrum algeriensis]QVQ45346.1 phage tail assembly chaperone [Pseudochrobactrum algeriensis]UCA47086.1 phage tail assembly chaperone [Pseudochrobactrum sp. XF203]
MLSFATGVLGWSPEVFWRSTWPELESAIEGRTGKRSKDIITPARAAEIARHYPPTKSIR